MIKNIYNDFIDIIQKNKVLLEVFDALETIGIRDYYIGAGVIAQTIWNYKTNKDICYGISDVDIVLYDSNHLDQSYEIDIQEQLLRVLGDFPLWLDVKNQARVHLWYKEKFGYEINPYTSLESAINTWPTTASSIGLRRTENKWLIYAPFGIEDLMNLRIVANNRQINEEIYLKKQLKWQSKWHELIINKWDNKEIPFENIMLYEVTR